MVANDADACTKVERRALARSDPPLPRWNPRAWVQTLEPPPEPPWSQPTPTDRVWSAAPECAVPVARNQHPICRHPWTVQWPSWTAIGPLPQGARADEEGPIVDQAPVG